MKTGKIKNPIFLLYILLIFNLVGCKKADYSTVDNSVYISEAENTNIKKIQLDEKGGVTSLTVRSSSFYDDDVSVKIGAATVSEIDAFNKRNGTNYIALPEDNYTLSETDLVIEKGKISAPTITVNLEPLTKEQIDSGDKFVLPLSIISSDEETLGNAKCMFYILDQIIITSVPKIKQGDNIKIMCPDSNIKTLKWTLEYRINSDYLPTSSTAQGLLYIGAGPATEIYLRFGDADVAGNRIMMKTQGGQFISNKDLKANTWYHMAWVHDGKTVKSYINGEFDAQMDSPGNISELGDEMTIFSGSRSQYMGSEFRFWTVARTQKQIKDNMFGVNSKTDGLAIYLKLNEGVGDVFKDSAEKYNVTAGSKNAGIEWLHGVRSDEQ